MPLFFLDYVAFGRARPGGRRGGGRAGSPPAAARTAARSSAARRRRCRASTRRRTTTSRASSSGAWRRTRCSAPTACGRATCSSAWRAAGCTRTATRSRAASSPSGCGCGVDDAFPGEEATVADVLLRIHRSYLAAAAAGARARARHGAHHRRRAAGQRESGAPGHARRVIDARQLADAEPLPAARAAGQVSRAEMFRTFNMGVGMVVITDEAGAAASSRRAPASAQRRRLAARARGARDRPGAHSSPGRSSRMRKSMFVAAGLSLLAARRRCAAHGEQLPAGDRATAGIPDQARASQDACQMAVDVFQFMAPQLGARARRRQRHARAGRHARRPRALLDRPARQRRSAATCRTSSDFPTPRHSDAHSARRSALPTQDADPRPADGGRGDRHLRGRAARPHERRRHRPAASARRTCPRSATRTTTFRSRPSAT